MRIADLEIRAAVTATPAYYDLKALSRTVLSPLRH